MSSIRPGSTTLVDLGSYKLELSIHGPPRRAHNPIIVIIPDIGSSIKEWTAVTRALSESLTVVNYERAGYGQSDPAPENDARTAKDLATELHTLLRAAKIAPPYILVIHGYGAIIAREFVALRNLLQFKGFVFVDADTEESVMGYSDPAIQAVRGDIDLLDLCYHDRHRLSDLEWQDLLQEEVRPEHKAAREREVAKYGAGQEALAATRRPKDQGPEFERTPVMVLHGDHSVDLEKIYNESCRLGTGSGAQRDTVKNMIHSTTLREERTQRKLLDLSERSRFQHTAGSGHSIHLTAPEAVVDAVGWILMQYRC
ncbi:hypothetical protein NM208_g10357 [Fusarium decemcellulare]|uniref:Uncharacterized protein n=1 Tax=Fusarium decemcellulare TaxID=57161 RepID=A0ACC1RY98_9HYPO|nr:hypothetical protein NM208_g10357 [Fusarium decemcellulare]